MQLLNKDFLHALDIHLSEEEHALLSAYYEDTLAKRVIDEVVRELSPAQVHRLSLLHGRPDSEVQQWLTANVTNLAEIVEDEVRILLGEIINNSDKF